MSSNKKTYVSRQARRAASKQNQKRTAANFEGPMPPKGYQPSKGRKQARKNLNAAVQKRIDSKTMVLGGLESRRAARADPRIGRNAFSVSPGLASQVRKIPYQVTMNAQVLNLFSLGMLTRALEKGFYSISSSGNDPYYAVNYIVQVLQQFVTGGVPALQQLPFVLLALGHAISPKEVGLGPGGRASYSNVLQAIASISTETVIGYQPYGFKFAIGPATGSPVNGFPTIDTTVPAAPTDVQSTTSFQEMFLLLGNVLGEKNDFKMLPISAGSPLKNDVATFAQVGNIVGSGSLGSGSSGFASTAQLEVPIFRPYLSALNSYVNILEPPVNRFNAINVEIAGDSLWLGGSMGSLIPSKHWGMQRYPKFHAIDFQEFGDVVAQWVSLLQSALLGDPTGQWNEQGPESIICPLTLQETLILLRNVIMTAFKATQGSVQGLQPYLPSAMGDNQFTPYIASAATCFLESVDMQLPIPLIENIRDLVYRKVKHTGKKDVEFYIPVLGQMALDVLSSSNYNYYGAAAGGTPAVYPSFTSGALFKKRTTNAKTGIVSEESLVETPINLVDGSFTSGFVAINNPMQLKNLAQRWNNWLKTTNLAQYSVTLGQLGTEAGINILFSGNMTRYWAPVSTKLQEMRKTYIDIREEKETAKRVYATQYANRLAVAVSSSVEIIGTAYEQVQSTWILPILEVEYTAGPIVDSSVIPRWQGLMKETNLQNISSGTDGITLATLHSSYAAKMVKARQSASDDWTQFFATCAAQGRGGVLSGLVGSALSALFPSAAPVINTVADLVPF